MTKRVPAQKIRKANFTKRKLKNGMTIIHEHRDLPVVSFAIANPFGASYETENVKGVAHFIEHLLFTGTETRTHEDISREIEKKGGILNAFTSHDVTAYWFKLPAEHLFSGMNILTDMLKNSKFEEQKFEKEKKVIIEELRMYHDNPQRRVMEMIEENLYKKPFGIGVGGTEKTVSELTRNHVFEIFKEKYNPGNYIIVIVGNADLDKVCNYLEKNFSKGKSIPKNIKVEQIIKSSKEERPGIDQAHYVIGTHCPMAEDKNHVVLEVLDAYIANGMSSRLFLEIREKRGLAYTVRSSINTEKNYSFYSIYVGTRKEAVEEVEKLIIKEFNEIDKMTEKDLEEAKERLIGLRKVSSEESTNVLNELIFQEISTGKAEDYYSHEEKIEQVTLKQVKELSKKLIKKFSTAAIVPK